MKREINTEHLGEFIHEFIAVPKSARLCIQVGRKTYCGQATIECSPDCVTIAFETRPEPAKKGKKK